MAESRKLPTVRGYLKILRNHLRHPVGTALDRVEAERAAVQRELSAYGRFAGRLGGVPTETGSFEPRVTRRSTPAGCSASVDASERIREAFRETVLADEVDGTDEPGGRTDGEAPAVCAMRTEFGAELADRVAPAATSPVTAEYKQALLGAARHSCRKRRTFAARLDRERESLVDARQQLRQLTAELDGTRIPGWYRSTFEERVDGLATDRQEQLRAHGSVGRLDWTEFCAYLYGECPWQYPVLTAVARLCESVTL